MLSLLLIASPPADLLWVQPFLAKGGLASDCRQVPDLAALEAALVERPWDAVLVDYCTPNPAFDPIPARLRELAPDLPLILIAGGLGEERAVEMLKEGVWDFVLNDHLARLPSAIGHCLQQVAERQARHRAEQALQESEAKYRVLAETAADCI
jgi:DNA-binding NtrC family response regulator